MRNTSNIQDMQCEICQQNESKYKCPTCGIRYCSLKCYKDDEKHIHKTPTDGPKDDQNEKQLDSNPIEEKVKAEWSSEKIPLKLATNELNELYQNSSEIQGLLTYNTVKFHLHKVYKILSSNVSGMAPDSLNMSKDMKRQLAIDYLNTLRYGGVHYNEAIEEFCQICLEKLDTK